MKMSSDRNNEKGQALAAVLAMMVVGTIMVVPILSYTATALSNGGKIEENVRALYAADAGIEDAIWKLKNGTIHLTGNQTLNYTLNGINGMTVDITASCMVIDSENPVNSKNPNPPAPDWLLVDKEIEHSNGTNLYYYTLTLYNNTHPDNPNEKGSNIKLVSVILNLPPGLSYQPDSTGGSVSEIGEPQITGAMATGFILTWTAPNNCNLDPGQTYYLTFTLTLNDVPYTQTKSGGLVSIDVKEENMGDFHDLYPYQIIAKAIDSQDNLECTIRASLWAEPTNGGNIYIRSWEINP